MLELRKDNFEATFTDEDDFRKAVREFDKAATWRSVNVSNVSFVPAKTLDEDAVHGGAEALEGSPTIAIKIAGDSKAYCMREWAEKSSRALCLDDPTIYRKFELADRYADICARLNQDLSVLNQEKEFLFLIRGDKIGGAFGDFNASWNQNDQMGTLKAKLNDMFGYHQFVSGIISHIATRAVYQLSGSISDEDFLSQTSGEADPAAILKSYRDALDAAGMDSGFLDEAIPLLEFSTGESGLAQIALVTKVRYPVGKSMKEALLGPPLKVNHRGSDEAVWDKYVKYLSDIATQYQNGVRGITELANRKIRYPYSCLTHCLKPFASSVPIKAITSLADTFSLFYPITEDISCTALDIYQEINNLINSVESDVSETKRLNNMEHAARMLSKNFNWNAYDVARPAPLGSRKEKET